MIYTYAAYGFVRNKGVFAYYVLGQQTCHNVMLTSVGMKICFHSLIPGLFECFRILIRCKLGTFNDTVGDIVWLWCSSKTLGAAKSRALLQEVSRRDSGSF